LVLGALVGIFRVFFWSATAHKETQFYIDQQYFG